MSVSVLHILCGGGSFFLLFSVFTRLMDQLLEILMTLLVFFGMRNPNLLRLRRLLAWNKEKKARIKLSIRFLMKSTCIMSDFIRYNFCEQVL